jgi:hypothetical protein
MANPVEMQTVSERMRQLLHFTGENFYGGIQWPENWPQLVAKEKYMFFPATPFVYEIPRFGETIRAGVQGGHPPTNAIIKNAYVFFKNYYLL